MYNDHLFIEVTVDWSKDHLSIETTVGWSKDHLSIETTIGWSKDHLSIETTIGWSKDHLSIEVTVDWSKDHLSTETIIRRLVQRSPVYRGHCTYSGPRALIISGTLCHNSYKKDHILLYIGGRLMFCSH